MKIEIAHIVNAWFVDEVFPNALLMAESRINLHHSADVEHWNNIVVKYVLKNVQSKFQKKRYTKAMFKCIDLEPAEIFCLYRFLHYYSIPSSEREHWQTVQRQFILDQLHKHLKEIK